MKLRPTSAPIDLLRLTQTAPHTLWIATDPAVRFGGARDVVLALLVIANKFVTRYRDVHGVVMHSETHSHVEFATAHSTLLGIEHPERATAESVRAGLDALPASQWARASVNDPWQPTRQPETRAR